MNTLMEYFCMFLYQFALTVAITVGFAIALEQLHITVCAIIGLINIFNHFERCSCDTIIDYVGCLLFMFPREFERLHKHPLSPRCFKLGTWVYNRGIVISQCSCPLATTSEGLTQRRTCLIGEKHNKPFQQTYGCCREWEQHLESQKRALVYNCCAGNISLSLHDSTNLSPEEQVKDIRLMQCQEVGGVHHFLIGQMKCCQRPMKHGNYFDWTRECELACDTDTHSCANLTSAHPHHGAE